MTTNTNAKNIIATIAQNTSSRVKVEDLCNTIYHKLQQEGISCAICNCKGIDLPGEETSWFETRTIWFKRDNKNDQWKAFQVIDGKNVRL